MIFSALLFGLISSLHCIGMCGPIAMMLPVNHKNPSVKALQILTYHIGRLTSYSILGLLFGLLGKGFYLAGFQQQLSIIVGIIMIVIAVVPERVFMKNNLSKPVYKTISMVKTSLGNQFKKKTPDALFTIGLLNGFLPCGLVYAALFGALAMNSVSIGVLYMFLYGLGTIPMMSLVVYISNFISVPLRNKFKKIIPIFIVIIGSLFILRGLGLNIAYVSPSNINLYIKSDANCHN